jgi:hypothetical protein
MESLGLTLSIGMLRVFKSFHHLDDLIFQLAVAAALFHFLGICPCRGISEAGKQEAGCQPVLQTCEHSFAGALPCERGRSSDLQFSHFRQTFNPKLGTYCSDRRAPICIKM